MINGQGQIFPELFSCCCKGGEVLLVLEVRKGHMADDFSFPSSFVVEEARKGHGAGDFVSPSLFVVEEDLVTAVEEAT